jgi:hypothetical protein
MRAVHPDTRLLFSLQQSTDFTSIREPTSRRLRINEFSISVHVEDPTPPGNKFHLGSECLLHFGRQTGGLRQVISQGAVSYGNVHLSSKYIVPSTILEDIRTISNPSEKICTKYIFSQIVVFDSFTLRLACQFATFHDRKNQCFRRHFYSAARSAAL